MNIVTRDLSYRDLDTPLTGLFCWDEAHDGPRPGILLIHGGAGLDAHAREQARRYAVETVQRALDELAAAGKVQSFGQARARRWISPPLPGFTTILLLPPPLPGD